MGANLLQVSSAYEQNGDIHIIFSNGQDINLSPTNQRCLVDMNSLSRAIETKTDSITHIALDQNQMYSILGQGTTVGYLHIADLGKNVVKITAVCGP